MTDSGPAVAGFCDGIKGAKIYGWAWWPDYPDQPVTVELWVNGERVGETVAAEYRPDLRAAGIGHGRYGWTFPRPPQGTKVGSVRVRIKDGEFLPNGDALIEEDADFDDQASDEIMAFVAAALGQRTLSPPAEDESAKTVHFLLYAPIAATPDSLGTPEYSYGFVLKAFEPMLKTLGEVHVVTQIEVQADKLYREHISRGETSVLLSFAPPHRTVLGLRCPVIPVIAWEFPTIPDRIWGEDIRHDWRFVLRQTGRAITLSGFAAQAVKAAMGDDFPVISLPAPVSDRAPQLHTLGRRPVDDSVELVIAGLVYDTRGRTFEPAQASPPLPRKLGDEATKVSDSLLGERLPSQVSLNGVVFTTVFSPKDGRKNWADMLTAFIAAHRECPDATLVLKMIGQDTTLWWWELHDILGRLPPFFCRVVVLEGYLSEDQYGRLIAASHWVVCASHAEGLCLPLIEFMSGRRPAISPRHTAMLDYINDANALIVESDEEYCGWPHDPANELTTTRHRVSWPSLREAYERAYAIAVNEPLRYADMAEAALSSVALFCSDDVVAAHLDSFLGLNLRDRGRSETPSLLISSVH